MTCVSKKNTQKKYKFHDFTALWLCTLTLKCNFTSKRFLLALTTGLSNQIVSHIYCPQLLQKAVASKRSENPQRVWLITRGGIRVLKELAGVKCCTFCLKCALCVMKAAVRPHAFPTCHHVHIFLINYTHVFSYFTVKTHRHFMEYDGCDTLRHACGRQWQCS